MPSSNDIQNSSMQHQEPLVVSYQNIINLNITLILIKLLPKYYDLQHHNTPISFHCYNTASLTSHLLVTFSLEKLLPNKQQISIFILQLLY